MNKKRQRRIRLIYDLALDIGAFLFGAGGLVILLHQYLTPELRDQPFQTSLEGSLGHSGTFAVFVVFCLVMIVVGLFFTWRTVRLLRNRAYMEYEDPPLSESK